MNGDTPLAGSLMMSREYLEGHAITSEIAQKYKLGFVNPAEPADRQFTGYLSIPYMTQAGIKGIKYRCVEDHDHKVHGGKYGQPEGQDARIFNPQAFFDADETIGIAEGEIDAIVATEYLGVPTIGIPGVDTWKAHRNAWRRTLEDYDSILIFVDGDQPREIPGPNGTMRTVQPGLDMAKAIAADVRGRGRLVYCVVDEDVASMVASGKLELLRERAGL